MSIKTSSLQLAEKIHRITVAPSEHFEFSSFLINDKKTCLIHAGKASLFQILKPVIQEVLGGKSLDYIVFSHVEGDESGATNKWLETYESSQLVCNKLSNMSLSDTLIRPAIVMRDLEVLELGEHKLQMIETPHFPHNWDAHMWFEKKTRTLFSSDFCCQGGISDGVANEDLSKKIIQFYERGGFIPYGRSTNDALKKIESLDFKTIAPMHGAIVAEDFAQHTFNIVQEDLVRRS